MNQLVPVSVVPAMTVSDVERVALAIAKGGLFGSKDPNAVLTLCLLAQAEGQHPAVVFRDYHIISGKPAKKAEAMLRDFINAGGKVEWHQLDDTCADATFSHASGSARIEWTLERAKTAGISTHMWQKYPRQMLRSRVISEGIRTVYPGATSGLYEEGEVRAMTNTPEADAETGEIIEVAPESQKVPGIHKIKQEIRQFKALGNEAPNLTQFETLVALYAKQCAALEAGQHEWWTGKDKDGNEFESVPAWIERRRQELTEPEFSLTYQLLVSTLNECSSINELQGWMTKHGDAAGSLDGEEGRKFEALYDEKEAALKLLAQTTQGA